MTRNQKFAGRENTAKVLFKNSINTLRTYSKTYSGTSLYTKSLLLQLKPNLPKNKYYENNGTVKRDLSIETDICILRRYCKKNRNKLLNREVVSAKSKYSINRTEIETTDGFKHDNSACGDSEQNVYLPNTLNVNLTSLVIDNLKELLGDWIKTYLLEKRETKEKIDSVLDSILHKLDLQKHDHDTSSSYTYTVDVEVVNRDLKQNIDLLCTKSNEVKLENLRTAEEASNLSVPLNGKYLRIISTLSLPRNTHRTKKNLRQNMQKIRHKKILLSMNKSSNYIFKSSKLDFLTLPTKSLTKHYVTYEHDETKEIVANTDIPRSLEDSSSCEIISDKIINKNQLNRDFLNCDERNRFYRKVYNDTRNAESNSKSSHLEKDDMLYDKNTIDKCKYSEEQGESDPLITINLNPQSLECHDKNKHTDSNLTARNEVTPYKYKYNKCKRNLSKYHKYNNIKSKQFTYLFRKSNNLINQEKNLLKHFQSIFSYFSSWEGKKDIKVDIQVNVFQTPKNTEDNSNEVKKKASRNKSIEITNSDVLTNSENDQKIGINMPTENEINTNDKQNIISLLDGAASQAKYLISKDTSTDISENSKVNCANSTLSIKHSKLAQEINELKIIIKSLATATEKIANDHLQRKHSLLQESLNISALNDNNTNNLGTSILNKRLSNIMKTSKCVQFSNIIPGSEIISGIKIKKEPKSKHTKNYNPRLLKKSTSYNIIESESILKVTDMTSAAQGITNETVIDEALTYSSPKSKSLFEVSTASDKNKLLAFYCDEFDKPEKNAHNKYCISCCSVPCEDGCRREPFCIYSSCNLNRCCNNETCTGETDFVCTEYTPTNDGCELCDNSSSSICIDMDNKIFDKKFTIRNRMGMGFWEGCLYCFLLWIPLSMIMWLFYVYVAKDLLKPKHDLLRRLYSPELYKTKTSLSNLPIPLADLGF